MCRIKDIIYKGNKVSHCMLGTFTINKENYLVVERDGVDIILTCRDTGYTLLKYEDFKRYFDSYGITDMVGLGKEYIYAFSDFDLNLLSHLKYIDKGNRTKLTDVPYISSFGDNIVFITQEGTSLLTEILFKYPDDVVITGSTLKFFNYEYEITGDLDKFKILMAKGFMLRR